MCVVWEDVVSSRGAATAYNGESLENFLCFSLFLIMLYLTINENYQHVQGWNSTTTTSFPGNIIIIIIITERIQTKKLAKRGCGGGIPNLNMFMIFINRKTFN